MARPARLTSSLAKASPVHATPTTPETPPAETAPATPPPAAAAPARTTNLRNGKVKTSFYLESETIQELKNTAKGIASEVDAPEGMSGIADAAIRYYIAHLEQKYNNGKPYPLFTGPQKRGPRST